MRRSDERSDSIFKQNWVKIGVAISTLLGLAGCAGPYLLIILGTPEYTVDISGLLIFSISGVIIGALFFGYTGAYESGFLKRIILFILEIFLALADGSAPSFDPPDNDRNFYGSSVGGLIIGAITGGVLSLALSFFVLVITFA